MIDYDRFRTNQEKRKYVFDLETKMKRLERENGILKKRLLVSHVLEYGSSELVASKMAK